MAKDTEVFVDCISSASLRDGVIRLEFGEFEGPPEEAEGKQGEGAQAAPKLVPKHRVFLPVPGFIRSLGVMQEVMKRLAEQGASAQGAPVQGAPAPVAIPATDAPGRNGPFVAEATSKGKPPAQSVGKDKK